METTVSPMRTPVMMRSLPGMAAVVAGLRYWNSGKCTSAMVARPDVPAGNGDGEIHLPPSDATAGVVAAHTGAASAVTLEFVSGPTAVPGCVW